MTSYLGSKAEKSWQDITYVVEGADKVHISGTRYFDKDDDVRDWKINTRRIMAVGFDDQYRKIKADSKFEIVLKNGFGRDSEVKKQNRTIKNLNSDAAKMAARPKFADLSINFDKKSCKDLGLRYSRSKNSCYKKCLRPKTDVYSPYLRQCVYQSQKSSNQKSRQVLREQGLPESVLLDIDRCTEPTYRYYNS
jgi:hypothetical protein